MLRQPPQYGGIDPYLLRTPSSLLGYEGIRLRILVHSAQQINEAIAQRIAKLGTEDPKVLLEHVEKEQRAMGWSWRMGGTRKDWEPLVVLNGVQDKLRERMRVGTGESESESEFGFEVKEGWEVYRGAFCLFVCLFRAVVLCRLFC